MKLDYQTRDGDTPLHRALSRGQIATSMALISNGADLKIRNNEGRTPLHIAAKRNVYLLDAMPVGSGVDANARASNGATPLIRAVSPGDRDGKELP